MPQRKYSRKASKRSGDETHNIIQTLGELTVNDSANSEVKRPCVRKIFKTTKYIDSWEQSLEIDSKEYDLANLSGDDSDKDNDITSDHHLQVGMKRKRRKGTLSLETGDFQFPIDIWELISDHISPEDVGRFGAICRTTAYVVSTGRFWHSLYNRFCCTSREFVSRENFVDRLDVKGLRHHVVRALHECYPPFQALKTSPRSLNYTESFKKVLHAQCVAYWHIKRNQLYEFVFKLYKRDRIPNQGLFNIYLNGKNSKGFRKRQPMACLHEDDACYLLQIFCSSFCQIAYSVVGQYLTLVCESPAEITNCRMNKITLTFSGAPYLNTLSPRHRNNNSYQFLGANESMKMVLQPVESVQVLPWWHKDYDKVAKPTTQPEDPEKIDQNEDLGYW